MLISGLSAVLMSLKISKINDLKETETLGSRAADKLWLEVSQTREGIVTKPNIQASILNKLDILLEALPKYKNIDRKVGVEVAMSELEKSMFNANTFYRDGRGKHASSAMSNAAHASGVIAKSLSEIGEEKSAKQFYTQQAVEHSHSADGYLKRYYGNSERLFEFAIPDLMSSATAFEKAGMFGTATTMYNKAINVLVQISKTTKFNECMVEIFQILNSEHYQITSDDQKKFSAFMQGFYSYGTQEFSGALLHNNYRHAIAISRSFLSVLGKIGESEKSRLFIDSAISSYLGYIEQALSQKRSRDAIMFYASGISVFSRLGKESFASDPRIEMVSGLPKRIFADYKSEIEKISEDAVLSYIEKVDKELYATFSDELPVSAFRQFEEADRLFRGLVINYYEDVLYNGLSRVIDAKVPGAAGDVWLAIDRFSEMMRIWGYDDLKTAAYRDFAELMGSAALSHFSANLDPHEGVELLRYASLINMKIGQEKIARALVRRAKLLYRGRTVGGPAVLRDRRLDFKNIEENINLSILKKEVRKNSRRRPKKSNTDFKASESAASNEVKRE